MEALESAIALMLSAAVIVAGLMLIYPYIKGKEAEQRLIAARRIAFSIRDAIESVIASGVGSSTSLRLYFPEDVVAVAGNNSLEILAYGVGYGGNLTLSNSSLTLVVLEPRVDRVAIVVKMKEGWNLSVSGISSSGVENVALITYEFYNASEGIGYIKLEWRG